MSAAGVQERGEGGGESGDGAAGERRESAGGGEAGDSGAGEGGRESDQGGEGRERSKPEMGRGWAAAVVVEGAEVLQWGAKTALIRR